MIVTVHTAKTTLSQLLARVKAGEEVIVARGRRPVARLVPCSPLRAKRRFGALKGRIDVGPDFFDPLPPEELEVWERQGEAQELLLQAGVPPHRHPRDKPKDDDGGGRRPIR